MSKSHDLIGKKFGRLTVLKKIGILNKSQSIYWKCICDCGRETKAHTAYLTTGRKASCGCIRAEKSRESIQKLIGWGKLPEGEGAFNAYYHQYRYGAKHKGIFFELTKEHFFEITQKNCFYCLSPPNTPHCKYKSDGTPKNNGPYISNGIDRIDSFGGYSLDNVVPCCRICNLMKQELSVQNFLAHIELLWHNKDNIRSKKC